MPEYKLYHFDTRFLADAIRFIFLYADVPFEDIRLTVDDWRQMKEKTPWEQLPVLELRNGNTLGQSGTIAQFLGNQFGLCGKDEWSLVRCQEISDSLRDMRQEWRKVFFQRNSDKQILAKNKFVALMTKLYIPQFNELVEEAGGKYLVCEQVTYADLLFAQNISFFEETLGVNLLEGFPKLKKLVETILEVPSIQEYLEKKKSKIDTCMLSLIHIAA